VAFIDELVEDGAVLHDRAPPSTQAAEGSEEDLQARGAVRCSPRRARARSLGSNREDLAEASVSSPAAVASGAQQMETSRGEPENAEPPAATP
ncbi:MAG: hypothetical protein SGPRY_003588, partial [Prymnesium sp.]